MTQKNTRRDNTQHATNVVIKKDNSRIYFGIFNAYYCKQQAWKTLKRVQGSSYLTTTRGFTARSVIPQCFCTGYSGRMGFTLIELLVVVLIIGLLAAVALPQYNRSVKKAQGREVLTAIDAINKAQAAYYLENGNYTDFSEKSALNLPSLQYFWYTNGSSPTSYQRSFRRAYYEGNLNSPKSIRIVFSFPNKYPTLEVQWEKGKLTSVVCGDTTTPSKPYSSCDDYFDCSRTFNGSVYSACHLSL